MKAIMGLSFYILQRIIGNPFCKLTGCQTDISSIQMYRCCREKLMDTVSGFPSVSKISLLHCRNCHNALCEVPTLLTIRYFQKTPRYCLQLDLFFFFFLQLLLFTASTPSRLSCNQKSLTKSGKKRGVWSVNGCSPLLNDVWKWPYCPHMSLFFKMPSIGPDQSQTHAAPRM